MFNYFNVSRELKKYFDDNDTNKIDRQIGETFDASDTGNDEVIACLLQAQFNGEYNTMLKRTEEKFNRDSKGNQKRDKAHMIISSYSSYFSEHLVQ